MGHEAVSDQFSAKRRSRLRGITWHDAGRELAQFALANSLQGPPDPAYPNGIDLDGSRSGQDACKVALPYPALRCGHYRIECKLCGIRIALSTAGRTDDPRSITLPCQAIQAA